MNKCLAPLGEMPDESDQRVEIPLFKSSGMPSWTWRSRLDTPRSQQGVAYANERLIDEYDAGPKNVKAFFGELARFEEHAVKTITRQHVRC